MTNDNLSIFDLNIEDLCIPDITDIGTVPDITDIQGLPDFDDALALDPEKGADR